MGRPTKEVIAYNKSLFEQGLIKCYMCNEIKPLDDFYNYASAWHGKKGHCKPCDQRHTRKIIDRKRAELNVIKETQGCKRCGYNEDGSKLHFHHRDPSTKLFGISKTLTVSSKRLQEEIDKCDILCVACHNIVEPRTPRTQDLLWTQ